RRHQSGATARGRLCGLLPRCPEPVGDARWRGLGRYQRGSDRNRRPGPGGRSVPAFGRGPDQPAGRRSHARGRADPQHRAHLPLYQDVPPRHRACHRARAGTGGRLAQGINAVTVKFVRLHPKNPLLGWIEARLPWLSFVSAHTATYYAPKNFNIWYLFGALAGVALVNQLLTGIFLAMHFKPSAAEAFSSLEYIMRDVPWGWLIRYMHSTGASLFFIVVYLHMFRALLYGSYKKPRELVWVLGMLVYLVLMAEAFMGYVLPWGQMSFWGAKVIISLFGAIPIVGNGLTEWIMGDYLPGVATLNRFFALHVIALPLVLLLLVTIHILAVHEMGSNNPDGIEIGDSLDAKGVPLDGIPFHPYYSVEDLLSTSMFLLVGAFIIFFAPTFGGWFLEHDNFVEANRLV